MILTSDVATTVDKKDTVEVLETGASAEGTAKFYIKRLIHSPVPNFAGAIPTASSVVIFGAGDQLNSVVLSKEQEEKSTKKYYSFVSSKGLTVEEVSTDTPYSDLTE